MTWRCCATAEWARSSAPGCAPSTSGRSCALHLRARPPTRRGGRRVAARSWPARPAYAPAPTIRPVTVGTVRRPGRHDPPDLRLRQAGRRLRLHPRPRPERADRHPHHGTDCAPLVLAQRLRKGSWGSPRGAKRLIGDAVQTGPPPARPRPRDPGPDGLGLLRPRRGPRRDHRRRARVGHRPDGPGGVKAAIAGIARARVEAPSSTRTRSSTKPPARGSPGRRSPRSRSPRSRPRRKAERVPGRLVVRRIPDVQR